VYDEGHSLMGVLRRAIGGDNRRRQRQQRQQQGSCSSDTAGTCAAAAAAAAGEPAVAQVGLVFCYANDLGKYLSTRKLQHYMYGRSSRNYTWSGHG
jgi:hypothetical protein